jgi:hypothetical protein
MILACEFGYINEVQLENFVSEIGILQKQVNTLITKIRHKPMANSSRKCVE